jgi:AsmA-like C-terminal region
LPVIHHKVSSKQRPRLGKFWRWAIPAVLIGALVPVAVIKIAVARAGPIIKGRVVDTLRARFGSDVQLDTLNVSVMHGVDVTGGGLRIFPADEVMAAGYREPVIAVGQFEFHATLSGLIFRPTHVGAVHVRGLAINIPPAALRKKAGSHRRRIGKVKMRVDEIVCDDSQLVIGTDKPDKDPRVFRLKHVVLRDLGPNSVWPYDAILTNPTPRGEIHAVGTFGPWNTDDPGDSNVSGKYTFDHADLNTIKGLGGILRSTGIFTGQLDRIAVHGKTEVPDFSLDTASHPMALATEFQAIVDGTSGDTYLERIDAKLGGSSFLCKGAVVNVKGQGHYIHVSVEMSDGRIQDFLQLAAPTNPPPMSGSLVLNSTLDIPTGNESVTKKLNMEGSFSLRLIHFTNADIQDRVDILSLRAQGETDNLKKGAPDVQSRMIAQFSMRNGRLMFPQLEYSLPGGDVQLSGTYRLEGRVVDFTGKVQTTAEISEMVASKWKRWLLKPVDPFFKKKGWGAVVPVKVTGSNGKVHFGYRF